MDFLQAFKPLLPRFLEKKALFLVHLLLISRQLLQTALQGAGRHLTAPVRLLKRLPRFPHGLGQGIPFCHPLHFPAFGGLSVRVRQRLSKFPDSGL